MGADAVIPSCSGKLRRPTNCRHPTVTIISYAYIWSHACSVCHLHLAGPEHQLWAGFCSSFSLRAQALHHFPTRFFESPPHCASPARRQRGHHECHPCSSSEHEIRSDRLLSFLLPLTQCEQMSGQARRGYHCFVVIACCLSSSMLLRKRMIPCRSR